MGLVLLSGGVVPCWFGVHMLNSIVEFFRAGSTDGQPLFSVPDIHVGGSEYRADGAFIHGHVSVLGVMVTAWAHGFLMASASLSMAPLWILTIFSATRRCSGGES